ncbi:MAG: DUF364 domain-containing protein [Dehalococcoidales bacterium]|nr:DUF364 domain-containing protein [Dehalococcoidales bacterium]
MKILDDLISKLNTEATTRDICQGLFHTAVYTRNCGLASTLMRDSLKTGQASDRKPGSLIEKSPRELVQMSHSDNILDAAIGMAAINSLVDIDDGKCRVLNARELILENGEGRKVAIIGHFPFTPIIQKTVKELWIIEKNPNEGDLPEGAAETYVPEADVVGITGTAFTNHTIEHLLELCNPEAFVIVIGDSAPLSPVLFEHGIDAISGTQVVSPDLAIQYIREGATYRQIKGIRQLTMLKKDW